ncbi:MAG: AraC family transcriptional regulator [Actinobacteria bacterium]|nr:AraC family transcriptional regulator [Actinomycetota bacterium]
MHAIRATCLLGFRDLVAELGADGDPILVAAGVSPQDAGRYDRVIPLRGAVEALELAADVTRARDFGRRLAARRGIETIGPVGIAAQTASTLADAFAVFATYISAHSPGLRVRLNPSADDGTAFFEFGILLDPPPCQRQATELSLGAALQILRAILGADYTPIAVHLPHSALAPASDYVRDFRCTPHFAAPAAGFVLRRADLRRRLHHDGPAHDAAVMVLSEMAARPAPTVAQTIAELTGMLLPTGSLRIELVAAHLQMHPRALQRRLSAEGTSFGALVDKVRRQSAERYLRDTDISLDHLTRLLGYSEQSVLTRSCRRWFGCAPSTYRRTPEVV